MTNDLGQINEKPAKGKLGYTVDGSYGVSVPGSDALVYVRFDDGSFAQVYHRGRVAPIPDLPVEVGLDEGSNLVILGGDPAQPGAIAGAAGAYEVGLHSHARGSGMEFPIDVRLLTPVRAAPDGGLVVRVEQGAYWYGGALRWWGGGSITLTPPASANQWAWIVVGINPAAGSLVAASGTAVSIVAPLEPSTIPAIALPGTIALAAVRVTHGETELDEAEFEDLRFPIGGRAAAYALIRDEKTVGTNGGTFTSGAWQTRDLNVKAADAANFVTLSSSQITLAAGTYRVRASAPAYEVGGHQVRWQNVSDGVTVAIGTSENTAGVQTRSVVAARFTISASKTFALQHQGAATRSSDGFGVAAGFGTEVYSEAELWRE